MDLVNLFHHVSPLLHACINNCSALSDRMGVIQDIADLRALRLVNKECSRVAPMGLRSYTLTLKGLPGNGKDTHVGGAALLQHTHLRCLRVNLLLSGETTCM